MDGREMLPQRSIKTGCHGAHCLQYGFLGEAEFEKVLISERKRTERSKRPFVLVLLNIENLINLQRGGLKKIHAIMKSFHKGIRETDVPGWYRHHRVMGIIYTEISSNDKEALEAKVRQMLGTYGDLVEFRAVTFPSGQLRGEAPEFPEFYEQTDNDIKKKMVTAGKRILDMAISAVILLLLMPIFLAIGILIKINSPGPVFFRQQRIGRNGRLFTFIKFRSMYVNNDDAIHRQYVTRLIKGEVNDSEGVYKITDDPRVTSVGRILRKTSLDELPQLFNVLTGKMALVGPRPPIPYELAAYQPWHFRRFMECKPGITGLWQVEGRSRTTFDGMVRMDIRYSKAQSITGDLMLLFRTPAALLFTRGAY